METKTSWGRLASFLLCFFTSFVVQGCGGGQSNPPSQPKISKETISSASAFFTCVLVAVDSVEREDFAAISLGTKRQIFQAYRDFLTSCPDGQLPPLIDDVCKIRDAVDSMCDVVILVDQRRLYNLPPGNERESEAIISAASFIRRMVGSARKKVAEFAS